MSGAYLWAWDDSISEWIKVAVNPSGELEVSGMEFPDDYPLPAAQVTDLKKITEIPDPVISQPDPAAMKHSPQGYDSVTPAWRALAVSTAGKLQIEMSPLAHAADHENGGDDEVDVGGLSGELADDQPPKAHLLGGAKHTADSLADLNALIDDATLDDSGDPRDPNAHKNSHDGVDGSDKLDTAAPVKVGSANAIGSSHSFARADHVHEREHAKYTDADAVDAIEADGNLPLASITFIIDGGGSAITTGQKGHLRIPFACTINRVTMMADVGGAIVVDIWKDTYANFPPDNGDSITASAPPTIAATNQKSEDSTLTGWTTAIAADDILAFNVDSCATITRVTISLKVTKT